jgi:hypothetical protein
MSPEFLRQLVIQTLPNLVAGILVAAICCACKPIARAIVRWRQTRLPKGPDADRAEEELDEIISSLHTTERLRHTIDILHHFEELRYEIEQMSAKRLGEREETELCSHLPRNMITWHERPGGIGSFIGAVRESNLKINPMAFPTGHVGTAYSIYESGRLIGINVFHADGVPCTRIELPCKTWRGSLRRHLSHLFDAKFRYRIKVRKAEIGKRRQCA